MMPFVLVPRAAPSRLLTWLSPLIALALTVLCGMLLFGVLGKDPLAAVQVFFIEPLRNLRGGLQRGRAASEWWLQPLR